MTLVAPPTFAAAASTIAAMQIQEVVIAARSPWQNAYVERFIGSLRRECLDHVIVLSAEGLQRVLAGTRSDPEAGCANWQARGVSGMHKDRGAEYVSSVFHSVLGIYRQ